MKTPHNLSKITPTGGWVAGLVLLLEYAVSSAMVITPSSGPSLTTTRTTINNGAGNQTDQHVS